MLIVREHKLIRVSAATLDARFYGSQGACLVFEGAADYIYSIPILHQELLCP